MLPRPRGACGLRRRPGKARPLRRRPWRACGPSARSCGARSGRRSSRRRMQRGRMRRTSGSGTSSRRITTGRRRSCGEHGMRRRRTLLRRARPRLKPTPGWLRRQRRLADSGRPKMPNWCGSAQSPAPCSSSLPCWRFARVTQRSPGAAVTLRRLFPPPKKAHLRSLACSPFRPAGGTGSLSRSIP